MCRWLAYLGPPIPLATLLTQPEHSLLDQSVHSRRLLGRRVTTTNGDGFGVGWYGVGTGPGLYRDSRPAWANESLTSVAAHVSSPLFLAHVRAASAGRVQETNCHPFRHGEWLFQHNGGIGGWEQVRRSLQLELSPEHYTALEGTTDSETCFLLALGELGRRGCEDALAHMVTRVVASQREQGLEPDFELTCALSDGDSLWALRASSEGIEPPTLFAASHPDAIRDLHGCYERFPDGGQLLVSEPLDRLRTHWHEVAPQTLVHVSADGVTTRPFSWDSLD